MQRNIGYLDRAIRFCIAMACVFFAFSHKGRDAWFWLAAGIGVVALLTALASFSPLYALLGLSSREKERP